MGKFQVIVAGMLAASLLWPVGVDAQTKPMPKPKAAAQTSATSQAKPATSPKAKPAAKKAAAPRRRPVRRAAPQANQRAPTKERYAEIQQALAVAGYYSGEANGIWKQESIEALQSFQDARGLEPTGKIDALSLIKLGLGPSFSNDTSNDVKGSSPTAPASPASGAAAARLPN